MSKYINKLYYDLRGTKRITRESNILNQLNYFLDLLERIMKSFNKKYDCIKYLLYVTKYLLYTLL